MSTVITEPTADVCVLGLGVTGGIVATELALKGYKVVGIEKGPYWNYQTDFALSKYDEWGVGMMHKWDHPLSLSSYTWRNNDTQFALPFRRYNYPVGFTALGHGVGGGAQHYAAQYGRYAPWTYTMYSSTVSKYGASYLTNIEPNLDLEDWPVTYTDMEPYYTEFEQAFGVTGTDQNPYIPMSSSFPLPAHPPTPIGTMFQTATEALGYHPFPTPTGLASKSYMNQYGVQVNECAYDGWCAGLCNYQCETGAKANPAFRTIPAAIKSGNFTMVIDSYIFRLDTNSNGTVAAARYYDSEGNIHVQPATVFFQGLWGFNNARLPLLSSVGPPYKAASVSGVVGRGMDTGPIFNPAAAVSGTFNVGANAYPAGNAAGGGFEILDFADDNFDHHGLNFIGGSVLGAGTYAGGGPNNLGIASAASAANIGSTYKAAVKNSYLPTSQTVSLSPTQYPIPQTTQYFDLDPHYTDIYGDPLARVTGDGVDMNGYNLNIHITPLLAPILTKMGASNVTTTPGPSSFANAGHTVGFAGYHVKGGTRMGANSSTSMLNMWQQCWTSENYFITGETASTSGDGITAGTHTIGPQAYLAAQGIEMYLKSPGLLTTTSTSSSSSSSSSA